MSPTHSLANARALRWRAALVLDSIHTLKTGAKLDADESGALLEFSAVLDEYAAQTSRGGVVPISRGLLDDEAMATWQSAKLAFEREQPSTISSIAHELRHLAQTSAAGEAASVSPEIEAFCMRLLTPQNQ